MIRIVLSTRTNIVRSLSRALYDYSSQSTLRDRVDRNRLPDRNFG